MGPAKSRAGVLKFLIGLKISSASSRGPVKHHTTPHIFFRRKCSGNGSPGGTLRNAKNPFKSLGAFLINSLYHCSTSFESLIFQSIGPPYTVLTGHVLKKKDVTPPKF